MSVFLRFSGGVRLGTLRTTGSRTTGLLGGVRLRERYPRRLCLINQRAFVAGAPEGERFKNLRNCPRDLLHNPRRRRAGERHRPFRK